jgi:uncharacterized membrane protein YedE/YeeE
VNKPALFVGLAFGFLIAAARLSDYDVIHDMLLLRELDVYLLMASAVATAAPLLYLLERRHWRTPSGEPLAIRRAPVQRHNIFGALVFGSGWAIAGTCPGPAIAMTVAGNVLGLVVMAGLLSGIFLFDRAVLLRYRATTGKAAVEAPTNAGAAAG